MSDYVDEMLGRYGYFDDDTGQSDMDDYLCLTDDELKQLKVSDADRRSL